MRNYILLDGRELYYMIDILLYFLRYDFRESASHFLLLGFAHIALIAAVPLN